MVVALVCLVAALMVAVERWRPGRAFPAVRGWWARAALLNAGQVAATLWLAGLHDGWLVRHRLWSGDRLGLVTGGLLGYLAITFVYYFWHRARHTSPLLWRALHQVHHSPQRIEVVTSFYKHPLEIAANSVLSSAILYLGLGLAPRAAAFAVLLSGLAELFYHWNIATPRWLGWFFQRPESHCLHHELGVHARNYADLPLWDWLFGTLENPGHFSGRCGFADEREHDLLSMLFFRDAHGRAAR